MTIDTSRWNKVAFGDIAKCLTIATKDPLSDGLDRYVGLEHIEPGNIHIKSWGNVADGTTFTRVFRKGQVLFGKRRAYQKKAAMAEFDGVCSGDILVCEAISNAVLPELLPFIAQSDRFFDYAIKTSAGSLSPRTKFKDLAKFTFMLSPKLNDQRRIADLLWSIDDAEESYVVLSIRLEQAFWPYFEQLLSGHKQVKLRDVLIPKKNQSVYPHKYQKYLGMEHIDSGAFVSKRYGNSEEAKANTFIFQKGDLLYGKLRPYLDKCVIASFEGVCSTEILVYDVQDGFSKDLALFYMHSPSFVNYVTGRGYGTKMPRVSHDIISEYVILMPSKDEQKIILSKFETLQKNAENLSINLEKCRAIKKQIINQVFG
ncbi:MAG: restriction endonuclease subunit S [Candidatus Omnitrophota bacterium]